MLKSRKNNFQICRSFKLSPMVRPLCYFFSVSNFCSSKNQESQKHNMDSQEAGSSLTTTLICLSPIENRFFHKLILFLKHSLSLALAAREKVDFSQLVRDKESEWNHRRSLAWDSAFFTTPGFFSISLMTNCEIQEPQETQ